MTVGSFRRLFACIAALVVGVLALAPAASARVITMGSDLKSDANVEEDHGADSAFWNATLASGGLTRAPVGGQVTEVRVKGTVLEDPNHQIKPRTMFHFQTLHPMGDGSVRVELSSAPFYTPLGGDPNQISTYFPVNMCLRKGDILDFNDIGGNEWHWGPHSGMPFQVFSRVRGSSIAFYTKNAGTNIGSQWSPQAIFQSEELLMQMKFASGPHATDICPGGYRQHVFKGLSMSEATLSSGVVGVRTTCPSPTYGSCKGVLRAETADTHVLLGSATFSVGRSNSQTVRVPVRSAAGKRVNLIADGHDDPRNDYRVYNWRVFKPDANDVVPVQHTTTQATTTLAKNVSRALRTRRVAR